MLTIIFDVFALPEIDESWWVPEAVLLGHEPVIHLDHLDAKLCRLIINLLQRPQHLWALFIFLVDCMVMWWCNKLISYTLASQITG